MTKSWEKYEEVAQFLLNKFAEALGLSRVEPKQVVKGLLSGTDWEIDAKGINDNGTGFIIVECRRYTTSRLCQEKVASLAYRIIDTGADGGITVSPLDLQDGAKKVAASNDIVHVILSPECTTHEYVMRFLDNVFLGMCDNLSIGMTDSFRIKILDAQGKIIEERNG